MAYRVKSRAVQGAHRRPHIPPFAGETLRRRHSQEEIEGIFRSAGQLITLFKDYTQEEVSSDMHDRLMSRLKNDQAK